MNKPAKKYPVCPGCGTRVHCGFPPLDMVQCGACGAVSVRVIPGVGPDDLVFPMPEYRLTNSRLSEATARGLRALDEAASARVKPVHEKEPLG